MELKTMHGAPHDAGRTEPPNRTDSTPSDGPSPVAEAAWSPIVEQPTSWLARLNFLVQFGLAVAITGGAVVYLVWPSHSDPHGPSRTDQPQAPPMAITPLDAGLIRIDPESSVAKKFRSQMVDRQWISTPRLRVVGTIAASLRPVEGPDSQDQWQFSDPEALAAYYEWKRAQVDLAFAAEQVQRIRQLNETRMASRQAIVDRMRRLVEAGTDSRADLQLAEAELLEAEIEGRRDIHEADSELSRARQDEAVAIRSLQLMGLEIDMLSSASSDVDIVIAEVPEEYQNRVHIGQQCEARFASWPGQVFPGLVQRISPTLSLERRSLRVLFFVDDPDDQLRPGMFADIGLGTDHRESLLVPATAVIHIGRDDFVFVRDPSDANLWQLTAIEVGDSENGWIEIFAGLQPGMEIITQGAILLKPVAAASLRQMEQGVVR